MDAPFLGYSLTGKGICSKMNLNENAGGITMKNTYIARRAQLMSDKGENTAVVIFSGRAPMKSQDEA